MGFDQLNDLLFGSRVFQLHIDEMHMHEGRRNDHCGGDDIDMRQNALHIGTVMGRDRDRIQNDRVDRSAFDVSRISSPTNHRCPDFFHAEDGVDEFDDPAKAGGIAGNDTGKLPADRLLVVAGRVEGKSGDFVLLSAFPDGFLLVLFVEGFVSCTDASGRCIDDDVSFLDHFFDRAGDLEACFGECIFFADVCDVKRVASFFGNVGLCARFGFGNTDYFHIRLTGNRVGDAFSDRSVSIDCNLDHSYSMLLFHE